MSAHVLYIYGKGNPQSQIYNWPPPSKHQGGIPGGHCLPTRDGGIIDTFCGLEQKRFYGHFTDTGPPQGIHSQDRPCRSGFRSVTMRKTLDRKGKADRNITLYPYHFRMSNTMVSLYEMRPRYQAKAAV